MKTYLLKWTDEEDFKLVENAVNGKELIINLKPDGDRYYDQDWVYLKGKKILHVDGLLARIYGEIFVKTALDTDRYGWDILNYEAEKLYDEYMKNPTLLNETEDAEYIKEENRIEREEKNNERFTEEDLDELAELLQNGEDLKEIIESRMDYLK